MTKPELPLERMMSQIMSDPRSAEHYSRALAEYRQAAAPLLDELALAGFEVDSVERLYQHKLDYRSVVPLLMKWLPQISDARVKTTIVEALAVSWAKPQVGPLLIREFRNTDPVHSSLQWAIGSALEVVADDSVYADMVELATDRAYGRAREMIVVGLGRMRDARAISILIDLLRDEEVAGHSIIALGRLKAVEARPHLEKFLDNPKTWIRKEAKKAIANIDKAAARAGISPKGKASSSA